MIFKKMSFVLVCISISLFAFNESEAVAKANEVMKSKTFQDLNSSFHQSANMKTNDFLRDIPQNKQYKSYEEQLDEASKNFTDDEVLNAQEKVRLVKELKEAMREVEQSKDFIIYFFSSSVPKNSVANVLADISILQSNGARLLSKQYLIGVPNDFQQYMYDWDKFLKSIPTKHQSDVVANFGLKMDSKFFKAYEVKKVPAIAFAKCATPTPDVMDCHLKYIIRGDVSLRTFFAEIIKHKDIKEKDVFTEYVRVLDANKIYKSELLKDSK